MKILIAAASFSSNISGVQRHALNLARCLLLQPEITELHFVLAPWQHGFVEAAGLGPDARLTRHIADMGRGSLSRNFWYYQQLPTLAGQLEADLVHLSCPMPVHAAAFRCPTIVTLHDLYPYEIPLNFGFPKFLFNRVVLRRCLHNVDAIACVSSATVARLKQYIPAASGKAVRIHNCVEAAGTSAAETPVAGWRGEPFLLSISQHRRNKNLALLIRSFNCLLRSGQVSSETQLVVVGIPGPETASLERLVSRFGLNRSVRFLCGLSESELQWCYRQCQALIAPSITEGFGLPIAEGLLAGCRIVGSDIPAHREIGEGQCTFVSLQGNAEETLAAAIVGALRQPKPQPTTLPHLSAPALAKQYVGLYRRVIADFTERSRSNSPDRDSSFQEAIAVTGRNCQAAWHRRENEHEHV